MEEIKARFYFDGLSIEISGRRFGPEPTSRTLRFSKKFLDETAYCS